MEKLKRKCLGSGNYLQCIQKLVISVLFNEYLGLNYPYFVILGEVP